MNKFDKARQELEEEYERDEICYDDFKYYMTEIDEAEDEAYGKSGWG